MEANIPCMAQHGRAADHHHRGHQAVPGLHWRKTTCFSARAGRHRPSICHASGRLRQAPLRSGRQETSSARCPGRSAGAAVHAGLPGGTISKPARMPAPGPEDLRCGNVDLPELGMKPSDLVLSPYRRTEPVMCYRRQHEESSLGGAVARMQPARALHSGPLACCRCGLGSLTGSSPSCSR